MCILENMITRQSHIKHMKLPVTVILSKYLLVITNNISTYLQISLRLQDKFITIERHSSHERE